ncbi:MAG: enolase C-terminal domain-like protein [Chloroflexota bacterium]
MKITNVRLRKFEGTLPEPPFVREERLRQPPDIYPEFKARRQMFGRSTAQATAGPHKFSRIFVQIDTDEGVSGIAGPVGALGSNAPSFYIETAIKPLLVGRDPIASELLWDLMYRVNTAGRKGDYMRAMSYVDIALWDLKGKWAGKPVLRLFGGPVQEKIPAYISALGYSLEPEKVKAKIREYKKEGYTASKWFFTEGPTDGPEGERKNIALMEALREESGPDMKIMIDAWKSWDIPYTLKMADMLGEYDPYWFEEPLIPDRVEDFAELTAACPVLITTGEQEYTRWAFQLMMDMKAADIYQPEPVSSGGISEVMKIYHMASARDVPVVVHCGSLHANLALSFAQNAVTAPMMEYLVLSQLGETQHFFKNQVKPVNGYFYPQDVPGLIELDESKIERATDVTWQMVEK